MGQRAPNRAGVTEDVSTRYSRREDLAPQLARRTPEDGRSSRSSNTHREQEDRISSRGDARPSSRHTDRGRGDRSNDRDRDSRYGGGRGWPARTADHERDRDRDREAPPRDWGPRRRDGDRQWGRGDGVRSNWQRDWRGDRRIPSEGDGRHRSANGVFGRSADDVFGKPAAASVPAAPDLSDAPTASTGSAAVRIGRPRR